MNNTTTFWASADFPYQCLIDHKRTNALRDAIFRNVKVGDIVIDAGAGSGILSLFAAEAGAGQVYAVEYDESLLYWLNKTIATSRFADCITVVPGDIRTVTLPKAVDVVICEMIETGLVEEYQLQVLDSLKNSGTIDQNTLLIPQQSVAHIELGHCEFSYFDHTILLPKHDWPHYYDAQWWARSAFSPHTPCISLSPINFSTCDSRVITESFEFKASKTGLVNALQLSGTITLDKHHSLDATSAMNGNKVIPIDCLGVEKGDKPKIGHPI